MPSHDAVIVGAGLIGTSIALRLAQVGLRVALLEKSEPGREASWAGAGMLSPAPDSPAAIPLVPFGRASLGLYPQFVAEIEEISGRRAGYRSDGAIELLFSANAERELSTLIALHHALGLPTEPLPLDEAAKLEPALTRRAQGAAYFPYEACVDNRALMQALLEAASVSGVELFPATPVHKILIENGRCSGVRTDDGTVFSAQDVIVAAGAFSGLLDGIVPRLPTRPIRGQMVALHSREPIRHVIRCEQGYIVPRDSVATQRLVTGSTLEDAGFDKCVTARGVEKILSTAQELVPNLANAEVAELWCGLRPDTPDHLSLLGPAGIDGLTIATGHYRNGILLTPITAKLVREWILEKRVSMDWEIFNPLRFAETASAVNAADSLPGDSSPGEEVPGNQPIPGNPAASKFAHK
jgi:glycine oxidase